MVNLEFRLESSQHRYSLFDTRLVDEHGLESPRQCGVLWLAKEGQLHTDGRRRVGKKKIGKIKTDGRGERRTFSIVFLYSSGVVAPAICNPRARDGLSMFPASREPSALPSERIWWISSCRFRERQQRYAQEGTGRTYDESNHVVGLFQILDQAAHLLFERSADPRSAHDGREVDGEEALVLERLGDLASDDLLSESFNDGGLWRKSVSLSRCSGFVDYKEVVRDEPKVWGEVECRARNDGGMGERRE